MIGASGCAHATPSTTNAAAIGNRNIVAQYKSKIGATNALEISARLRQAECSRRKTEESHHQEKEVPIVQDVDRDVKNWQTQRFSVVEKDIMELVEEIRKEKGLGLVFARQNAGLVAADPTLDLTNEVMQYLNTAP